jgi:uncharacterized protein YbjT (DUF2867 family)
MNQKLLITGATGLVGGLLAKRLDPAILETVGRRAVAALDPRVVQHVAPIEAWPDLVAHAKADVAICCLGTTLKQAGSQAAFAAVDRDAVISFATAARAAGAAQFLMISSVGASATASSFYLKIKGETEAAVAGLGFERVDIFRPGLLRGNRGGERRAGESAAIALSPFTDLLTPRAFDKFRSIAADQVAAAMAAAVGNAAPGLFIHHNRDMLREAARIG